MRRVFLHVGAHKTASSMLQANLAVHRERLRAGGLHVVSRAEVTPSAFAAELYEVSQGRHDPENVTPDAARSLGALVPSGPLDVLITSEDLICHLPVQDFYQNADASMRYLQRAFSGVEPVVILYIRNQADYLESVYIQYVHLGRRLKFGQFLEQIATVDYSWLRVVETLERALPARLLRVRAYESIRVSGEAGFYHDFLSMCGVEDPQAFDIDEAQSRGRPANRSYSHLGLQIAQRINPLLNPKEKKIVRRFLQEHFSTATHPRAVLFNPEQRAEIFETYRESNRALFARRNLGVQGDGAGYF